MATEAGRARLLALVKEAYTPTTETRGGVVKQKTHKQLAIDHAVALEVVRFAFDHGGYKGAHLAPTGLWMELRKEIDDHPEGR
jgi:hypothetical protein